MIAEQIQSKSKKYHNTSLIFVSIIIFIYFSLELHNKIHVQFVIVSLLFAFSTFYYKMKGNLLCLILLSIYKIFKFSYYDKNVITSTILIEISSLIIISIVSVSIYEIISQNIKLKKDFKETDSTTGFYNFPKLIKDLNYLKDLDKNFILIFIKIDNFGLLLKEYDFKTCNNYICTNIKKITNHYSNSKAYIHSINQYFLIIENESIINLYNYFSDLVNTFEKNNIYKNVKYNKVLKVGIVDKKEFTSSEQDFINISKNITIDENKNKSSINLYDREKEKEISRFNEIALELPNAIINNEFFIVYQPIIDLKDKCISSCEILTRWNRKNNDNIGPNIFIKVAEEIGIIQDLTKWIASESMKNFLKWQKEGYVIKQSINITITELLNPEFRKWSKDFICKNNVHCSNFGIEITERVKAKDLLKLKKIITFLKDKGYIIEIDDFGTGYNSLIFLSEIPTNVVKIDKYFIDKLFDTKIKKIIKSIIDLVHSLGSIVIAEGVETKKQYEILKEIDCDKIQGYYFSKPLKPDSFLEYYKNFNIENY